MGALRGAGELAGGLLQHLRHPLDAAVGSVKMASHLPLGPIPQLRRLYEVTKGERSLGDAFFCNPLAALGEDLSRDGVFWGEVVRGIATPYMASIDDGQRDEALGRGLFDVGSMFFGAGALGAAGEGAALAAKLPKGGGLTKLAAVEEAGLARVGAKGFKEAASGTKEPLRPSPAKPGKGGLPTKPRPLNPAAQDAFHAAIGASATRKLLVRFGPDALEHYGVAFFQALKGVTDDTMNHLLEPGRISKGEITGCHDEGTFLRVLVEEGNGAVVSRTPAPYPGVVKYEYNLFKRDKTGQVGRPPELQARQPLPKTVLTDLAANPEGWRVEFQRILDTAIAERVIVPEESGFGVSVRGISWTGHFRDGELKTVYPEI